MQRHQVKQQARTSITRVRNSKGESLPTGWLDNMQLERVSTDHRRMIAANERASPCRKYRCPASKRSPIRNQLTTASSRFSGYQHYAGPHRTGTSTRDTRSVCLASTERSFLFPATKRYITSRLYDHPSFIRSVSLSFHQCIYPLAT
jgi:hypothetical protein